MNKDNVTIITLGGSILAIVIQVVLSALEIQDFNTALIGIAIALVVLVVTGVMVLKKASLNNKIADNEKLTKSLQNSENFKNEKKLLSTDLKNENNFEFENFDFSNLKTLENFLSDNTISFHDLLKYFEKHTSKKDLTQFELFRSKFKEYLRILWQLESRIEHKGKCYIIKRYLYLLVSTMIKRIREYIEDNINNINSNTNEYGIEGLISKIYDSVDGKLWIDEKTGKTKKDGYKEIARKEAIPDKFQNDLDKRLSEYWKEYINRLNVIKNSIFYRTDYIRIGAVLEATESYLNKIFSERFIEDEILKINGELIEYFDDISEKLKKGLLRDNVMED